MQAHEEEQLVICDPKVKKETNNDYSITGENSGWKLVMQLCFMARNMMKTHKWKRRSLSKWLKSSCQDTTSQGDLIC